MDEVSPAYYAAGEVVGTYELNGRGFMSIPNNAIGTIATDNNAPESNRGTSSAASRFRIVSKSDTKLVVAQIATVAHSADNYLGAIYSADFSTSYWVNNTKPLPENQ